MNFGKLRIRFTLKALILVVGGCAVVMAIVHPIVDSHRRQRTAADELARIGGRIFWTDSRIPWLRRVETVEFLGVKLTHTHASTVRRSLAELDNLVALTIFQSQIDDAVLTEFGVCIGLERINLDGTTVRGLEWMANMSRLRYLSLVLSGVNDNDLQHLGHMPQLELVILAGNAISARG